MTTNQRPRSAATEKEPLPAPMLMKSGTLMTAPVSSVAGLVPPAQRYTERSGRVSDPPVGAQLEPTAQNARVLRAPMCAPDTVFPFSLPAVSTTLSVTDAGSSTSTTCPENNEWQTGVMSVSGCGPPVASGRKRAQQGRNRKKVAQDVATFRPRRREWGFARLPVPSEDADAHPLLEELGEVALRNRGGGGGRRVRQEVDGAIVWEGLRLVLPKHAVKQSGEELVASARSPGAPSAP